ncbi:MAG: Asp-tRNA(Asn)/Glu-tRNA(Gln) amidotransferase subunit GatB, partial [Nitrospiria bacterium]
LPLCERGYLDVTLNGGHRRIGITRIHLEEDAGKNLHEGIAGASHVDLNRAGVPLLEIVSEPDIRSPEEAVAYLKKFRDILMYLEVCDGNMEEGSLRCDANVSLRLAGRKEFGTKTELKNINSFRFVQKALEYEIERQEKVLRKGGQIMQETRLWDPERGVTVLMRSKEEAHDYRYFPEPDLVPLQIPVERVEEIRKTLPELPEAKRERLVSEYGISEYNAEVITADLGSAKFFESSAQEYKSSAESPNYENLASWFVTEVRPVLKTEQTNLSPKGVATLLTLMDQGKINRNTAKKVQETICATGRSPEMIVEEQGLTQVSDEQAIEQLIDQVLIAHPKELLAYRQGKEKLFGFFVGQVMKQAGGKANPAKVNELLRKKLVTRSS